MHKHCEIIMPGTKYIDKAIAFIMEPFNRCGNSRIDTTGSEFWDVYLIGGAFSDKKGIRGFGGGDICLVKEIPPDLTCSRVIFAVPSHNNKITKATYMICTSHWNGVNFMPINWDGNVKTAIKLFEESINHYREELKEPITPKPNWLCITIDYHT